MRWPTVPAPDGKGEMIDQDAVNELVDYAIAHGVNYFDTSPMYVQVNPEKRNVPLYKNDAFQKVQKRRVPEKR